MVDKDKLKLYRELNDYDMKKVARRLKVPKSIVREWEEGTKEVSDEDLEKLAKLYNVSKKDLLITKKSNKTLYFIAVVISLLIPSIIYCIYSDIPVLITNIICLLILLLGLIFIKNNYTIDETTPKSLFCIELKDNLKDRILLYIKESLMIGSIYILITNIFKVIDFDMLVINYELLSNRCVNDFVISIITYLLLSILTFIIELGFGEYIWKKTK